jgi:hypothetical protein
VGEAALAALPDLLRAAEEGDRPLMEASMRVLSGLKTAGGVVRPVLLRLAEGEDAWRARAALAALGHLGGDHHERLAALFAEAAQEWDWRIRLGAKEGRAALVAADK